MGLQRARGRWTANPQSLADICSRSWFGGVGLYFFPSKNVLGDVLTGVSPMAHPKVLHLTVSWGS